MRPGRENKPHIGIYGRCNVGKSTLLNYLTQSEAALVSAEHGTTTDPVRRAFEILDFAPVIFIDTAGLDDRSSLGEVRIKRSYETLSQIDLALLVFVQWGEVEEAFAERLNEQKIPWVAIYNRFGDELSERGSQLSDSLPEGGGSTEETLSVMEVDLHRPCEQSRNDLLEAIRRTLPEQSYRSPQLFGGRISLGDHVWLVCPIDSEAPSGRLILPQVQALRELLDLHAIATVIQPQQIECSLASLPHPKLVVTDSQLFGFIEAQLPRSIELTSFSILLSVAKGDYATYLQGLEAISSLKEGDRVLMLESCLHQVSCEDIGRVKIPQWLEAYTGVKLRYEVVSGLSPLPDNLSEFALAVQCGGCMVTRRQVLRRIEAVRQAQVPITNYGLLIRHLQSPKL